VSGRKFTPMSRRYSTYENNRHNREDHYCFVLLFGSDSLVPIYACFQDVRLLLFEVQKILKLFRVCVSTAIYFMENAPTLA
jgi:hypothetical protein